jgi:FkbM family methyltransferase
MIRQIRRLLQDVSGIIRIAGLATGATYVLNLLRHFRAVYQSKTLTSVDRAMDNRGRKYRPLPHVRVTLPAGTFGGAREMYCRRVYFRPPGFTINPFDVVVDLGANQGLFSVLAASAGARVVAIEAQGGFCELMRRNLQLNDCAHRVTLHHGLVGAATGVLSQPGERASASHWTSEPPVVDLERVLHDAGIDHVDLLKCDIEGSEFDLFRPSSAWLDHVDRVALEVHADFGDPTRLASILEDRGFTTVLTDEDCQRVRTLTSGSGYLYGWRGHSQRGLAR